MVQGLEGGCRGTLAVWGDGLMEQSLECQATEPKEQEEATGP